MKNLLAIALLFCLLGCSNPADHVPAATVNTASASSAAPSAEGAAPADSAAPTEATEAAAPDQKAYAFGPGESKINFVGSKVTGSHIGGFNEFTGEFQVADGKVADNGIQVVIDMDSLWSDSNRLTGHLKNEDFFDVPKHPTSTFRSTAVDAASEGATVTGDLTLHGVTKSITFPAQIDVSDDQVSLKSEFSLNRFDFDIKYSGKSDDLIRKEVVIKLDINATPGATSLESATQADGE